MTHFRRLVAALLFVAAAAPAGAQTVGTVAPVVRQQFFDSNGNPLAGGLLHTYAPGTTTNQATYSDATLATPLANPIVLDSAGRTTYFLSPTSYRFRLETSASVLVWDIDNIAAVPSASGNVDVTGTAGETITAGQPAYLSDGSGGTSVGQWYKANATNGYSSILNQVGMVPATIASGQSGTIRLAGRLTGLGAVVTGSQYFVGLTAGSITSTAPQNRRFLGTADSTSSIVLLSPTLPPLNLFVNETAVTTTYAVLATDQTILATGTFTVTLPTAVGRAGQIYTIKNASTGVITIATTSSQTIDGSTTELLRFQYHTLTVESDNANWHVIDRLLTNRAEFDAGNSGAAITINFLTNGPLQKVTRTANTTITLTAPATAGTVILKLVHEASGTVYTVAFSPTPKYPNGTVPTYTNTSGAIDVITFYWDGTTWYGVQQPAFSH